MLRNLYRWLCNPGSALHDPALQRAVTSLMGKLFAQVGMGGRQGDGR
jgi:hypothetical protein